MATDDLQVLGWLFTARDEASDVLGSAQEFIDEAAAAIDDTLEDLVDDTFDSTQNITNTFMEFAEGALDILLDPLQQIQASVVSVTQSFLRLPVTAVKQATSAIQNLGQTSASAAIRVNEIVQNFITLDTLKKGLVAGGGLFGALLGPFGSLLNLFSPLVDVLVEGLSPAVESFAAIFKTSFNELFELAEVMAQMFAPLLQEFIEPMVSMMEVLAVEAAAFFLSLVRGESASSGIASLFQSLGPVIMDIFRALGGLGRDLLPVVVDIFSELAPIAVEIVKDIGQLVAKLLPAFGQIAKETIPPLAKAFLGVLEAVTPLIEPLGELATVLISKVFGPAVVAGATFFADWITDTVVPFINDWMPAFVKVMGDLTARVDAFYSDFSKNMSDFKILFLDPIADWFADFWVQLGEYASGFKAQVIDPIWKAIEPFLQAVMDKVQPIVDSVMGAYETLTDLVSFGEDEEESLVPAGAGVGFNVPVQGPGSLQATAMAAGMTADEYLREVVRKRQGLAEGGIVTTPSMPVIGEAGPEAVVPLTADKVQEFLGPVTIKPEGVGEVLGLLAEIRDTLRGTLKVDGKMSGGQRAGRDDYRAMRGNMLGTSGAGAGL